MRQLEVGIRDWIYLWPHYSSVDRFFYGRDVSDKVFVPFNFLMIHLIRMYDREINPISRPTSTGMRNRIETLIGITGVKMAKYRLSWYDVVLSPFHVMWRPHLLGVLVFEVRHFLISVPKYSLHDRECFLALVLA